MGCGSLGCGKGEETLLYTLTRNEIPGVGGGVRNSTAYLYTLAGVRSHGLWGEGGYALTRNEIPEVEEDG